jgi:N-acetyltransferase
VRLEPVVLTGRHTRLEPLAATHLERFCAIGLEPALWEWTTVHVSTREEMRLYIESALADQRSGTSLPFATVLTNTGLAVGYTRFTAHEPTHRRVEIGSTWVAPEWQRTVVNAEAKLLMFEHAFSRLGCARVELKTDALNHRSRGAIRRLGAVEEGTLRKHMTTASGRVRDTVYFSIIDSEWPAARDRLRERVPLLADRRPEG